METELFVSPLMLKEFKFVNKRLKSVANRKRNCLLKLESVIREEVGLQHEVSVLESAISREYNLPLMEQFELDPVTGQIKPREVKNG